jgi:LmbE family N-acetylglucosaminyl deacetylase
MKILVIATHPDDEVLGCGGVIARHASEGDEVHVLVVTRGAEDLYSKDEIETTRKEMKQAHAILGVKGVTFLDFPAPKLDSVPHHQIVDAISKVINTIKPYAVFLPHRGDIHSDHRAVYHATLVAARPINNSSIKNLLCYETLSETEWAPPVGDEAFIPTVFVNISSFLEKKLAALSCYQSQMKAPPHPRSLKAVEALAHLRGSTVSLDAAEAFMLVRAIE